MSKKNFIKEYLNDDALDTIVKSIAEIEKKTSGEMRVCIKKKRGFFQKNNTPREIALKEFRKLKMHKTKDRTGVMLLIIFDEHKFEIIADEGINSKISIEHWSVISEKMKSYFTEKNYLDGILFSICDIGEILASEFPVNKDDTDELSNEIIFK